MTAALVRHWRHFSGSSIAKHCTGLAALFLLFCAASTQVAIDGHTAAGSSSQFAATDATGLHALMSANAPLRGVAGRISKTEAAIDGFYSQRIPTSYSQISSRILDVGSASGVQLSHVAYDQRARESFLTEVSVESQVTGTYPQIMRFVNGLERDQACFVIRAMALTGQQGGEVNLQLRFSTWLRSGGNSVLEMTSAKLEHATVSSSKENE